MRLVCKVLCNQLGIFNVNLWGEIGLWNHLLPVVLRAHDGSSCPRSWLAYTLGYINIFFRNFDVFGYSG